MEQLYGYTPRSILEKVRVAEALEQLPASRAALEQGRISWSALRELTRVAVKETEDTWLQAARGKTVRQIEELVAGKRPGDAPSAKADPRAVRYRLPRNAQRTLRALLRKTHAGSIADDRRPTHERHPAAGAHVGGAGATALLGAFLDLHHIRPRSEGGSHSLDHLVTLCSAHHRALHRGELRSAGDASDFRALPGELGVPVCRWTAGRRRANNGSASASARRPRIQTARLRTEQSRTDPGRSRTELRRPAPRGSGQRRAGEVRPPNNQQRSAAARDARR